MHRTEEYIKEQLRVDPRTLRAIVEQDFPDGSITIADLSRIQNGKTIKSNVKRKALGLPCLAEVPVCPEHGVAHLGKCPAKRRKRKPPPAMTEAIKRDFYEDLEKYDFGPYSKIQITDCIEECGYRLVRRNAGEKK